MKARQYKVMTPDGVEHTRDTRRTFSCAVAVHNALRGVWMILSFNGTRYSAERELSRWKSIYPDHKIIDAEEMPMVDVKEASL